jgi:hypothetical protein
MVHAGRHRITTLPEGYNPNRTVEARELRKGDFLKIPRTCDSKPVEDWINKDVARLLGYYLSEGNISYGKATSGRRTGPYEMRLTFAAHELDTWVKNVQDIGKRLGMRCVLAQWGGREDIWTVRIIPKDKKFLEWIIKSAGEKSYNKVLSDEVMCWPEELLTELIRGWARGDGCRSDQPTPAQKCRNTKTLATVQIGTTSERLATQMMLLLSRLGFPAGHGIGIAKPSKYDRKPYHILRIQGKAAIDFCQMIWSEKLNANTHRCSVWYDDEFMYVPIRSVKEVPNNKPVYNLEIEGDHTYLICDGLATHNSAVAGLQTLLERLSSLRKRFEDEWIIKKLCNPVAEMHEFYQRSQAELDHRIRIERPEEKKLITPKIKWKKPLEASQDVAILGVWRELKQQGILSERTYSAGAGVDLEVERRNVIEETKYKQEHPEIYGLVAQPEGGAGAGGAPGGMGGPPGGAKPKPPGGPGAPAPAEGLPLPPPPGGSSKFNKYGADNPYGGFTAGMEDDRLEVLEDRLHEYSDGQDKLHIEDVMEILKTGSVDSVYNNSVAKQQSAETKQLKRKLDIAEREIARAKPHLGAGGPALLVGKDDIL